MRLDSLQQHWQALGERDPLWAVLTHDHKKDNRWDRDELLASGAALVEWYQRQLAQGGVATRFQRGLDFGCGVGRMTQALCGLAREVVGVDIAPAMVAQAIECNRQGDRARYLVNDRDDLRQFADGAFDLVHSTIVLQHMHPIYQRRYAEEFMRVLAPGGVLILQVASDFVRPPGTVPPMPKTRASGPLPVTARRARLSGIGSRLSMPVLGLAKHDITIENLTREVWPALGDAHDRYTVKLGARWRRWQADGPASGAVLEGMRTLLSGDVAPRTPMLLPLYLAAPEEPGQYALEIDLLQEDAFYFADAGPSAPLIVSAEIVPEGQAIAAEARTKPTIEMYCVPRTEMLRLFERCGAERVHATGTDAAGPECASHFYFVQKGPAAAGSS